MSQVFLRSFTVGVLLSFFMGTASSQAATPSEKWNLEGTWNLSVGYFNLTSDGGCTVKIPTGGAGAVNGPMAISKSASGYSIRVNIPAEIRVLGNQVVFVEKLQYGTLKWQGAISQKLDYSRGKRVTRIDGVETCNNQATLPFSLIQEEDMLDPRSEAVISTLNPQVQPYARELVRKSSALGIQIKIIQGFRTDKDQDALYCQGRNIPYCNGLYKPGNIVTKAKGGYSNHNFGIAFDVGVFDGNKYLPESPYYNDVGKIGEALGLEWGGNWKTIKDRPHFQLRPQWATNLDESKMIEELRRRTKKNEPFYP